MPSIQYYNSIIGTEVKVSGQNVGIGTATPSYKLDVAGTGNINLLKINDQYTFPTGVGSVGDSLVYSGSNQIAWSGITGGGTHPTIAAASSSDNADRTYIQDILLDSYGHVTGISTSTETVTDTTYSDGSGILLDGNNVFHANVASTTQTTAPNSLSSTSNRTYSVQVDSTNDKLVVNVPWADNNTTYTDGSGLSLVGSVFHANVDSDMQSVAPNSVSSTAGRTYAVQVDSSDNLVVNVPWADTDTTVPLSGQMTGDIDMNSYSITGVAGADGINIDGDITANYFFGDLNGPIVVECKNSTGSTIAAGTPVYVSGYYSNNGKALISVAKANDSSKMPAIGLLESSLSNDTEGYVHCFGLANHLDSSVFSVGQTVYVHPTGGLTDTRPTGVNELVQNIGRVLRSDSSQGRILVLGPGRTNDVPNSGHFEQLTVDEASNFLSTIYAANIGAGEDNSVVVLDSDGKLRTDEIDSRVWGSSLVDGNGTANYVPKWSDTDTLTNSIIYDDGTNVGIGTATPQAKLDVNGTVQFDDLVRWEYPDKALDTSISTLGYMRLYDEAGAYAGLGVSTSSFNVGTSGLINLRMVTNAIERAIIDTSGNITCNPLGLDSNFTALGLNDSELFHVDAGTDRVGIGTASPGYLLDVAGSGSFNALNINNQFTFPTGDGTSSQVLATDGNGNVSWSGVSDILSGFSDYEVLTTSKSTFTVNGGYTVGSLDVYYNGLKLIDGDDYTATNGTTFTLASAAGSADVIEWEGHRTAPEYATIGNPGNYRLAISDGSSTSLNAQSDLVYNTTGLGVGTPSPSYKLDVNGTFSANSINVNDVFTLPTTDGSNGQSLSTDGAGNVTWEHPKSSYIMSVMFG